MLRLNEYWKNIMNYGALLGIPLSFLSFCGLTGYFSYFDFMTIPCFIIGLYYTTRIFRDKFFNGFMSYGKSLKIGTQISLFASIIVGFVVYLIFTLHPELKEQTFKLIEDGLLKNGFKEDTVETFSAMIRQNSSPIQFALSSVFSFTFYGFIFMVILSFFIKKEGDPLQTATKDIHELNNL